MHRFLRTIGFSQIKNRKELETVLGKIMQEPDSVKKLTLSPECEYTEFLMNFGPEIGIVIRGEYDEKGFFYMQHYFPFCKSRLITSSEDIIFNKRVDSNAYTGMCDDLRLGISLIFYLQNAIDYMQLHSVDNTPQKASLTLSGLSLHGTILLGIYHDEAENERKKLRSSRRNRLISKAKNGDQKAIDDLTLEEIDLSSRIQNRIQHEDLYSIVETTFIPYGSESDHYSIVGTILNWNVITNSYTQESVCQMLLNCNDILLTICINKSDLLGEPMIGRRFKGVIWMQGYVHFQKKP